MSARPLAGRRVVITRAAHQAAGLAAAFAAAAAEVVRLPLIELGPPADPGALEDAARRAAGFDWLVLTSANAVDAFLPLLGGRLPGSLQAAAVGPATSRALERYGVKAAHAAREPRAEGLVEALRPHLAPGAKVLAPQAEDARPELARGLAAAGAEVTAVAAYGKRLPAAAPDVARRLFSTSPLGWVTFTSPRIARHFAQLFAGDWQRRRGELRAVSIGPVTSAELRRLGVEPAAEAAEPSDDGMAAAAILAALSRDWSQVG